MKRQHTDEEPYSAGFMKRPRLGPCHKLDIVVGPPSNFEIFNVSLDLICEHSKHFRNLYCKGTIAYGIGKAIMLPNLTSEFFRVYLGRLEDSSYDLSRAVRVVPEGVDPESAADEDQVLKQLHRLCTWWRGADFLEDHEFKNGIMDVLVDLDIERGWEILPKLAYLVAGEEMRDSGLRLWWVDCAAATLNEDIIDGFCGELSKEIVVDLLKAQLRASKAEDSSNRLRGAEQYYEQDQRDASGRP
ncbi:hypothetical protein AC578_9756 [Pseudocercospora eumusae]|uniref:BTB domain-containing protein n=1 Tax=Pseudocercospora eumusae TaxID=321146 RepID=A0A139HQT3_9PEZI|nr:hypothetical protein AC578_9756 [Pseudocercospora eumusae]